MRTIKGITVKIIEKTQTGVDDTDRPIYTEKKVDVDNVLVGEPSTDDITNEINLSGKLIAYVLAIPKGDTHNWVNTDVELPSPFEGRYHTIGIPTAGIEENIPLSWNKKVKLEAYE